MKIWVDNIHTAPEGYVYRKSVDEVIDLLSDLINFGIDDIEVLDIDHNAGDYVKLLAWLKETGRNYPIRTHSQNPVGGENM